MKKIEICLSKHQLLYVLICALWCFSTAVTASRGLPWVPRKPAAVKPDPEPSKDCAEKYKDIIENAEYLDSGAQGSVFKTFDPESGRHVALKVGMVFTKNYRDGEIYDHVPRSTKEEVMIMEELGNLMEQKKTKGFVRLLDHFQCGEAVLSKKRIRIDTRSQPTIQYIVMELLDRNIDAVLNSQKLPISTFGAYLFQTLMALTVARREISFVGRDLPDGIMVYSEPNNMETLKNSYFGFVLPDKSRLYIPKRLTQGRYTKLIDFGHSLMVPQNHHIINTMEDFGFDPFPSTRYYDDRVDLVSVVNDFIMKTPQKVFDDFKRSDLDGYHLLLDFLKSVLGGFITSVIATKRLFRSPPAHAKFIYAWKQQQPSTTIDNFETYSGSYFSPSKGGFTLDQAVKHPLFNHLFGKYRPSAKADIEYLSRAS